MMYKTYNASFRLLVLLSLLIITQLIISAWEFTTDDIYISLRYAKHLALGHGIAWNISEPRVEGYSNFLYVLIATAAIKLKLSPDMVLKFLSTGFLYLSNFNLYCLARRTLPPFLALLSCLVFSSYLGTIWWAVSGMETLAYVFLISLCLLLLCKQAYRSAALILFLACLARPEAPVLFIVITGVLWYQRENSWEFILWFLVPYTLYFVTRSIYFCQLLPNPVLCKHYMNDKAWVLILNYLQLTAPFWLFVYFNPDRKNSLFWLPSLVYLIILYNADPIIGQLNRHFLAVLPLLIISATGGLYYLIKSEFITAVILIIMSIFTIDYHTPTAIRTVVTQYEARTAIREQTAAWLNHHLSPEDFYVVSDAGLIPYLTHSKVLDSFCLNSRAFVSNPINYQYEKYADWLMNQKKPKAIVKASYLFNGKQEPFFETINNSPALRETFTQKYQQAIVFTTPNADNFQYTIYLARQNGENATGLS